jgi:hypothetical protein
LATLPRGCNERVAAVLDGLRLKIRPDTADETSETARITVA